MNFRQKVFLKSFNQRLRDLNEEASCHQQTCVGGRKLHLAPVPCLCNIFAEMDFWLEIDVLVKDLFLRGLAMCQQADVRRQRALPYMAHSVVELFRRVAFSLETAMPRTRIRHGNRGLVQIHPHSSTLMLMRAPSGASPEILPCTTPKKGTKNGPGYWARQLEPVFGFTRRAQKTASRKWEKIILGPSQFLLHLLLPLAICARQLRKTDMGELTPLLHLSAGRSMCQRQSTFTKSDQLHHSVEQDLSARTPGLGQSFPSAPTQGIQQRTAVS